MPEIIDTLLRRRSIRQFLPESVDREMLILLLKAAKSAPTACNSQPLQFSSLLPAGIAPPVI